MYPLVDEIIVNDAQILIKFGVSLKTSTIINDNFDLYKTSDSNSATPTGVQIVDPFEPIVLADDYNSISRILTLTFKTNLQSETGYTLWISGLKDAAGTVRPAYNFDWTTDEDATPSVDEIPPVTPEITFVDYTVEPDAFEDPTIVVGNEDTPDPFILVDSDPYDGEAYLPEDYQQGVVTLKFSTAPDPALLTNVYFQGQKKKMQRGPARWENISLELEPHSTKPWVLVKFPSIDTTPVYDTAGKVYFEENYKYRIKISEEVGH